MKIEEKGEFTYAVESESNSNVYTVCVPEKGIPSCDCKGFAFSQKCKHVDAVLKSLVPEKGKKSKPKDEKPVQKEKNEEPENENPESEEKTEIESDIEKIDVPAKYIARIPYKTKDKDTGREYVKTVDTCTVDGYLYVAHKIGFQKMLTDIIQFPSKENDFTCFCSSYILTKDGTEFRDIGDANESNIKRGDIKKHYPRMAGTRSLGRVLRRWLFPYVGLLCTEELEDENGFTGAIAGNVTLEQQSNFWKLYTKFDFPQEHKQKLMDWTKNLSMGDGDYVIKKLKEYDSFDYDSFITLKQEIIDRNQQEGEEL